jgi:signal peptidase I
VSAVTPAPARRSRKREIRWGLSVLGLCAFFLVLRWQVIEAYHIPSPSMEPTLRGDPVHGDKVFVNKLAFRLADPKRWQIVVFRHVEPREGERIYVKRLVGLPGEGVEIRDGDVFIDDAIARKPRDVQEELLMPVYRSNFSKDEFTAFWNVQAAPADWEIVLGRLLVPAGRSFRATTRAIVMDHHEAFDNSVYGGENPASDLALAVRFKPLARMGSVSFELAKNEDRLELRLEGGFGRRMGVLRHNGRDVTPVGREPLEAGREVSLLFWNIDGEILVEVDGRTLYSAPYVPTPIVPPAKPSNSVRIEVSESGCEFVSVFLSRDVFYTEEGDLQRVRRIELSRGDGARELPGYFFLGDNSPKSQDSRHWLETRVAPKDWIGTPFVIFWPPERIRILR